MTRRLSREESRNRTRSDLVQAATELFADLGVARTSTEAVAERAGYSRGAYHSNFGSREELLEAVAARVVGDLGPKLATILGRDQDPLVRLAEYISSFLDYCERQHVEARAMVAIAAHRAATSSGSYEDALRASASDLVALFETGQTSGAMRRFDCLVMAGLVRRSLDAEALRVASGAPAVPLAEELTETFVRATRADRKAD